MLGHTGSSELWFAASVGALVLLFSGVSVSAQTAVTAADLGGATWTKADNRGAGRGAFVFGPATPPGGLGSYELSTPDAAAKIQLLTTAHSGTPLADITAMSYWTYRAAAPTGSPVLPALNLRVDTDLNDIVDTYLIFEPYQAYGNVAVQSGIWQKWDAYNQGTAKWWVSKIGSPCSQSAPCPWSQIRSLYPTARILEDPDAPVNSGSAPSPLLNGSFGVNQGSGNPGVVAYVDLLSISVLGTQTVYDFEPLPSQTIVVSNVTPNGWGFFQETPTGSGSFVTGPAGQPAGTGSAEFIVNSTGGELLAAAAYAGVKLADITKLRYHTYRVSGGAAFAPSLQLQIDYDVADTIVSYQGRLVFEPYLIQPSPVISTGSWQSWDPQAGRWWATRAPGNTVCTMSLPCTWAQVRTKWPRAAIHPTFPAIGFKAGGGWSGGFQGSVDKFLIAVNGTDTTYDFEFADRTPPVIDSCAAASQAVAHAQSGTAPAPNLVIQIVAHDNVTPLGQLLITQSPAASTLLGPGAHSIGISVKDAAGNEATCAAVFTVIDTTPPVISACAAPRSTAPAPDGLAAVPDFTSGVAASDNVGIVSVSQSPAAGSLLGAGAHLMTVTVADAAGLSAACRTTFTVESANSLKRKVLAEITALRATVTDTHEAKQLDKAIDHLARSLQADWWIDVNHLDPRRGDRVFNEEKDAVVALRDLLKQKHTVADGGIEGFIARIGNADRLLASVALADAQRDPTSDAKAVAKALDELARGDQDFADGKQPSAIEHYRNAWKAVQKA